ncbi:hypothetical protein BJX61DRAFT_175188 [Aspergillus egyptiacus]|nr:hypothetical protein BJX61DRAFT_175188 [Aspergillus egyptiacus]
MRRTGLLSTSSDQQSEERSRDGASRRKSGKKVHGGCGERGPGGQGWLFCNVGTVLVIVAAAAAAAVVFFLQVKCFSITLSRPLQVKMVSCFS